MVSVAYLTLEDSILYRLGFDRNIIPGYSVFELRNTLFLPVRILREHDEIRNEDLQEMRAKEFIEQAAIAFGGDYARAFKLLGFVLYLAEDGPEPFLSGRVMSPRTYHRWIEELGICNLDGFAMDARLRQLVNEYVRKRFGGLPIPLARSKVLDAVGVMIGEKDALSLQAISRHASARVQGEGTEAEGREAETNALDAGADGGSVRKATAQDALDRRLGNAGRRS